MKETIARRRTVLFSAGVLAAAAALGARPGTAEERSRLPDGAGKLRDLTMRLAQAPRRRSFDRVPFMLTDPQYWDHEAAAEVLEYSYPGRQVWENSEIAAAWPNLMREAINYQVFASGNPDFLPVSATHGFAHLALFSQSMWDKYNLAELAGPKFTSNTLILEKHGTSPSDGVEDVAGYYGPANNNIVSLQRRGAVFIACHDSIHAIARTLHDSATPPAGSADATAADLTNNLLPGAVLVPSVVGFLVDLQSRGFTYAKGS
jgi:intracellular sulfur oxidation DsrE/DsrF family protein